ncbi:MAG: PilZ domain-containing protein [Candidatus Eremiobacteraeota bacterium]|nr:PilZ domain-containing protein [Candidatus Eremiobacteraeota bacterium]
MRELRESLRFTCSEEVVCMVGRRKVQAEILDVSRGGLRLRLSQSLPLGRQVEIKPKHRSRGRAPVTAVVRWQGQGEALEAGLEFTEPAGKLSRKWLRKLFPGKGKAWTEGRQQRAEVRAGCRLPVVSKDGNWEGELLDLSASGARFLGDGKLSQSTELYLCLPWDFVEVRATPVRVARKGDDWIHSVKFSELQAAQQEHLRLFVEDSVAHKPLQQTE